MNPATASAVPLQGEGAAPAPAGTNPLTVSVLICTSGRGAAAVETIQSILRSTEPFCELLVIDQSTDDRTEEALRSLLTDARLRYIRSATRGKGIALNIGLEEAKGEVIAITDDDCTVDADWPRGLVAVFEHYPQVAVVYGTVVAAEHDPEQGYIPAYTVQREVLCRSIRDKLTARGIGANMAVRKQAVRAIGGFDPELGPGGRFRACVDGDITVRALLAGYHTYETPRSTVLHYGFRTSQQGRQSTHSAFYGIGAAYVKPLRCGRSEVFSLLLYEFWHYALKPSLVATLRLRRPTHWQRVFSMLRGVAHGWRTPVDCTSLRYRPEEKA